ncbi:MAG: NAD(P)H-dependent oxidoreductase [Bacteroidota bacterium]
MAEKQAPLLLVNGSPRGLNSNTRVLLEALGRGLTQAEREFKLLYLQKKSDRAFLLENINEYDTVLWGFPMYTDAMPGSVKAFWEDLTETSVDLTGKTFGYLVQMGFPEASQANMLLAYLQWFSQYVGVRHAGILVRGGVEGIQIQPHWMKKNLLTQLERAGYELGIKNVLAPELCQKIAKPYRLKWWVRMLLTLMNYLGLVNFYWDKQLKQNEVYTHRYDTPYMP